MTRNRQPRMGESSLGSIVSVRGSVIDAHFPGELPPLNRRLTTCDKQFLTLDDRERNTRSASARHEAGLVRRFIELTRQ